MEKKTIYLLGFIVLKFLLQYILISPEYDLQRDEYLHLDQAHHLAWGFQSIPPFTSWTSYLIYGLGNAVFWVKFFPALYGALTIVVVWKAIESLNGNLFACCLGATCVLLSALLRLNTLYQPNSLDVLCWTAFYFVLVKYIQSENRKWLFAAAVVFAVGMLNKYNIAFLLLGLLPALLLTEQRKIGLQPKLYLAALLSLLLLLPNLVWQFQNHFPVVRHLTTLAETQLVHIDRLNFFKIQLLFFLGAVWVLFFAFYALVFYKPFKPYRCFFWSLVFTLAAFSFFRAKDYYAIGLYPIYIAFGSVFIADRMKTGWKKYARPALIVIPVLLFIPMYQVAFPNKSPEQIIQHNDRYKRLGMLRWEDGRDHLIPQDFADMLGWKDLAVKVDSVFRQLPDPDHTMVICDNYGQAGAVNYYTGNRSVVAHSFDADYINWLRFDKPITNVVLVKDRYDRDRERTEEKPLFDTVYLAAQRINKFAREDSIFIYVLRNARVDVNKILKAEVVQVRNAHQ